MKKFSLSHFFGSSTEKFVTFIMNDEFEIMLFVNKEKRENVRGKGWKKEGKERQQKKNRKREKFIFASQVFLIFSFFSSNESSSFVVMC